MLQIVYTLLHAAGLSLVDKRNAKNQVAAEICDGRTMRHKLTLELLNCAAQQRSRGRHYLRPPRLLLFWYTVMPAAILLSGVAVAKLANYFFKW